MTSVQRLVESRIWSNFPNANAVLCLDRKFHFLVILFESGPERKPIFLPAFEGVSARQPENGIGKDLQPCAPLLCSVWCPGNPELLTAASWFPQRRVPAWYCDSYCGNTLKSSCGRSTSGQVRWVLNTLRMSSSPEWSDHPEEKVSY